MMESRTALVIEDNPADAALVRALLDGTEFVVRVAHRLADGAGIASSETLDIAILDMSLPDAHGLEVLFQFQQAAPDVPVVILSGDNDEERARAAVQSGAQDYLLKSAVTEGALRRALRYAIERNGLHKRLAASVSELEKQRESVLELNQLKNDLIATLAHDIKGPLTSITGFAELLEDGVLDGAEATDAARTIRTNAQRLANLANDVLALSRVEHGELEIADDRVELSDIVRDVIGMHPERAVRAHVDGTYFVRGDAARLKQVFDNLLRNAIKYDPAEGSIDVRVERVDECVRVSFIDRGIGIPPEDLPRLFERFARAANARRAKISGTGLGLFIARMIVERHGGRIEVSSTVGEGSTFTVALPAFEASSQDGPSRITILSSDASLSRFIAYELRARGHRVREFRSLSELESGGAMRLGEVILADGRQVRAEEVRPAAGRCPIVGLGGERDGFDASLPLPFLVADLLHAVERV